MNCSPLRRALGRVLLAVLCCGICACTKSGGSSGGDSGGNDAPGFGDKEPFRTNCGTVMEGDLHNPVDVGEGFVGRATVAGPNLIILSRPTGDQLIKLHSLGSPGAGFKQSGSMNILKRLVSEEAIFFPASKDCSTSLPGGALGTIGQIFTASGLSYSEELIQGGSAEIESDPCGSELITSCYRDLQEEVGDKIAGELTKFLWKPVSDSNGRLAIHTGPFGTTVVVNGETGTNSGPGNGYGSLARFSKAGCGYGGNARVEVRNKEGLPYAIGGQTTITIPNGCNRYCLEGGQIVQCVKS